MSSRIFAPWDAEQVALLNEFQTSGIFHPFTCGDNRTSTTHLDGEGVLVATTEGWKCPFCSYRQNWAATAMLEIRQAKVSHAAMMSEFTI